MSGFADCKPEADLVERARRGDMRAHETLYAAYGGPVYTLAMRLLGEPAQADEILQETCVEVIRHLDDFRDAAAFAGWVKRIATNKCLAQLRGTWHRRVRSLGDESDAEAALATAAGEADPGPEIDDGERLARALSFLPPTARAVVWLYDVEGYSHREIAELMGKSVSFSKSQLARAHQRLRDLLATDEEVHSCMRQPSNF
ncbi:MAG TPA: RNA polymerase sigma factor [Gammaproteobacteria bacterium]|nr:RNA polymerase sigma factor [Gammaproteobacteria bacterium]